MNLRLGVIGLVVAIALCAIGAGVWWRGQQAGSVPRLSGIGEPVLVSDAGDGEVWRRESVYLDLENDARWPTEESGSRLWEGQTSAPADGDPVRVLVLGDSFVYGHGVSDPDMLWWVRLEDRLNALTAPGTFEVVARGRNGASLMEMSRWVSAEGLHSDGIDAVVVGMVFNDALPSAQDMESGAACAGRAPCAPMSAADTEEYKVCVDVPEFDPAAQERAVERFPVLAQAMTPVRCDTDSLAEILGLPTPEQVVSEPSREPFGSLFTGAMRSIVEAAGQRPVLVLATPTTPEEADWLEGLTTLAGGAGATVVQGQSTASLIQSMRDGQPPTDLQVHPGDRHPGPRFTSAYAEDAAAAVLASLPAARDQQPRPAPDPSPIPLVTSWMPSAANVTPEGPSGALFSYRGDGPAKWEALFGEQLDTPPQWVPCATLGRPHVRLMLDRFLPPGTTVTMSYESGEAPALDVYQTGYTGQLHDEVRTVKVGVLREGEAAELEVGGDVTGILLAPDAKSGCPTGEEIGTGSMEIRLTRQ